MRSREDAIAVNDLTAYRAVRGQMLPGDVIAFGGRGIVSDVIKWATRSSVSHVGVVRDAEGGRVDVVESTSLDGFCGVTQTRLSARLLEYDGCAWWLPLADDIHHRLDLAAFWQSLDGAQGKSYDLSGAILAGLARLGLNAAQSPDASRLYCSELVAAALVAGGAIPSINTSAVTPAGLVEWRIFGSVKQLIGEPTIIPRFASRLVGERSLGELA